MSSDNSVSVTIRPIRVEDQPRAAEIWLNGLNQTTHSLIPWLPHWLADFLAGKSIQKLAAPSLTPEGDIGPNGCNLCERWNSDDRTMFVATRDDQLVGLIGVKLGRKSSEKEPNNTREASVWKLSVAESARRCGVATALMSAAQEWARQKGCRQMTLMTLNPVAHDFYVHRMHYQYEINDFQPMDEHYPVVGRFLPRLHRYFLDLEADKP